MPTGSSEGRNVLQIQLGRAGSTVAGNAVVHHPDEPRNTAIATIGR